MKFEDIVNAIRNWIGQTLIGIRMYVDTIPWFDNIRDISYRYSIMILGSIMMLFGFLVEDTFVFHLGYGVYIVYFCILIFLATVCRDLYETIDKFDGLSDGNVCLSKESLAKMEKMMPLVKDPDISIFAIVIGGMSVLVAAFADAAGTGIFVLLAIMALFSAIEFSSYSAILRNSIDQDKQEDEKAIGDLPSLEDFSVKKNNEGE